MAYPTCCVVRASIAFPPGRSRFWATCGVTFKFLHSATKSAVSYALSPPTVTCFVRGIAFGGPVGLEHLGVHDQPVAVLHQQVPVVTQLGFFALAFACHLRIRVRLRFVRLVRPLLPVEVHGRIARIVRRSSVLRILTLITLHT